MSRRSKRILLVVLILAVATGGAVGLTKLRPEPPKKEVANLAPLVDVAELEPLTTNFVVSSQGTVRPRTETALSAEVSGTITEISPKFIAGGVFSANEVLLRIDATDYRAAVERAEALVRQRQIEYDGAQKLRSQGYRAETEYASAAAALAAAKADSVQARRNLERTTIRLPYSGMVREKAADLGQFVAPGTRLGTVFATDFAEVRLPLTDRDLAFVSVPAAADVGTGREAGPAVTLTAVRKGVRQQWTAHVVRSEGVVDETNRVTYVVARIDDPYRLRSAGEPLPVGTFVTATIEGSEVAGVFRVPRGVLRRANELLFVDAENRLRPRTVEVIHADSEFAYVKDGVSPGDRIVVSALESPFNGMAVRTEPDDVSDAASGVAASKVETP